jgi:hypothetical protein
MHASKLQQCGRLCKIQAQEAELNTASRHTVLVQNVGIQKAFIDLYARNLLGWGRNISIDTKFKLPDGGTRNY